MPKTANSGRVDCSNGNRLGWDDVDWRVVLDYLNKPFLRSKNIFFKLNLLIKKDGNHFFTHSSSKNNHEVRDGFTWSWEKGNNEVTWCGVMGLFLCLMGGSVCVS